MKNITLQVHYRYRKYRPGTSTQYQTLVPKKKKTSIKYQIKRGFAKKTIKI